jgi:diaminohydroxyphosphoribosylaminopyrimidine deaminase/5-amino-6-(5-phosphoribosylamino)uracil reductase
MIEAGATLSSAFIATGLTDEIIYYQAPKILGKGARDAFDCTSHDAVLQEDSPWQTQSIRSVGQDIKWVLQYKNTHQSQV